ncbi:MAG: alpha/beta hydrolase family protein [Candidatus Helarchaeota archaeon]
MLTIRNLLEGKGTLKKILLISAIIMVIVGPIISFVYTYKDVNITEVSIPTDDGFYLQGTVYQPKTVGVHPLVISHHGFTCNKEFMNQINIELARAGYCVLAYNSRGHSTSGINFNEYMTWSYKEVDDVISAIEFMLSRESEFHINRNISLVGHSHGAFTVAIAGNKTYTYQGHEYYVNACVPIAPGYSWETLINRLMPNVNYAILQRITRLANLFQLSSAEMAERSPNTYLNQTYPTNLMIIIGTLDEFFTVEENKRLMANAIYGDENQWQNVQSGVVYNNSGQSFTGIGYMRKIVVEQNIDHVMECFVQQTIEEVRGFLDTTIYGSAQTYPFQIEILPRQIGVLIAIAGAAIGFFPLASYSAKYFKTKKERYEYAESARSIIGSIKRKQFINYILGISGAAVLGAFTSLAFPTPIIPYLITDIVGQVGLMTSLYLFIAILAFYKIEKDNFHIETPDDIGLNLNAKEWGANALLGVFLGLISSVAISVALLPIFYSFPRNVIGFFLVFIMFLPFIFSLEIISKGFIQQKFANYNNKYKEWIYSAIVSGIIEGIALDIIIAIIGTLANFPMFLQLGGFTDIIPLFQAIPMVTVYIMAGPLLFITLNMMTCFIFQRTRNVISSTLFLTILLSWLLSGMTPISFPLF